MANNNVNVNISATDNASGAISRVTSELNGLSGTASSSGQSLEGMGSKLEGMGTGALKMTGYFALAQIGLQSFTAALEAAKSAFIDYNAKMEMFNMSMKTMLGSQEAATTMILDLNKFAAQTPFDLPGVQQATKRLLAFGWSAKDVIPTLTAVGDASAALGLGTDGINRMTLAIGQMKAKGQVQGDELLQLAEAGVPAYDILAEKLHLTADQVHNIGRAGIDADTAIKALQEGMEERFGGMMSAQAETFTGMLSTVKDNAEQIFGSIGEGLFNALKKPLEGLRDFTSEIQQALQDGGIGGAMQQLVPPEILDKLGDFLAIGQKVHDILQPAIDNLYESFKKLGESIGLDNISSAIDGIIQAFSVLQQVQAVQNAFFFDLASTIVDTLTATVNVVVSICQSIAQAWDDLCAGIDNNVQYLEDCWDGFVQACDDCWDSICDYCSQIWDSICETIDSAINSLVSTASEMYDEFSQTAVFEVLKVALEAVAIAIGVVCFAVYELGSALVSGLESAYQGACDICNGIADAFNSIGESVDETGDEVSDGWDDMCDSISDAMDAISDAISDAWDDICDGISDIIDDISDAISDGWDSICDFISDTMDSISDTISEVWDSICETVGDIASEIYDTILDWFGLSEDDVSSILDDTASYIDDVYNSMLDAISEIMDSIYNVGVDAWDSLNEATAGLMNEAYNMICSAFASVKGTLENIWNDIANSILNKVGEFVKGILDELGPLGTLIEGVGTSLSNAWGRVTSISIGGGGGSSFFDQWKTTRDGSAGRSALNNHRGHTSTQAGDGGSGGKGHGGGGRGGSGGSGGADKAAEKAEKATNKMEDLWYSLSDKIAETGSSKYQKSIIKLENEIDKYQSKIQQAANTGADTGMIANAKKAVEDYAKAIKDKLLKEWRDAFQELGNQIDLVKAKLTGNKRSEAIANYKVDLDKLQKDKEKQLKDVARNDGSKEDAEAKLRVDEWYNTQKALLTQKMQDDVRSATLESYSNEMDINNSLLAEHKATAVEINNQNRDLLNQKIAYLNDELKNEKLTAEEKVNIHKELADSIKAVEELPETWEQGFKIGLTNQIAEYGNMCKSMVATGTQTASALNDTFTDVFFDTMTGQIKSLGDYFDSFTKAILKGFAQMMAQAATFSFVTKFLKIGIGGVGAHATGGRVNAYATGGNVSGNTFLVGENGPELMRMDGAGASITSTHTTQRQLSEQQGCNVVVNVINETGQQVTAQQGQVQFDGEKYILSVVMKAAQNNTMGFKSMLKA